MLRQLKKKKRKSGDGLEEESLKNWLKVEERLATVEKQLVVDKKSLLFRFSEVSAVKLELAKAKQVIFFRELSSKLTHRATGFCWMS